MPSTPRTRTLSEGQVSAAIKVLEYNWPRELGDYLDQRFAGLEPNDPAHIFTQMALVDQALYDHEKTAETFFVEHCNEIGQALPGQDGDD